MEMNEKEKEIAEFLIYLMRKKKMARPSLGHDTECFHRQQDFKLPDSECICGTFQYEKKLKEIWNEL